MDDGTETGTRPLAMRIRRAIIAVIVVSFGLAALGGIVVLLGFGWSDATWKVLTTTTVVGAFSVATLCCAALIGRRTQWFGMIGAGIAIVSAVLTLVLIWVPDAWSDAFSRILATLCAATALWALASLLLLLADHRRRAVRTGLVVTLALIGAGYLLLLWSIWDLVSGDAWEVYWRISGVLWILAALGVILLPVLSLLLRGHPSPDGHPAAHDASPYERPAPGDRLPAPVSGGGLSAGTWERVRTAAAHRGVDPDTLIGRLLDDADREAWGPRA